MLTRRTFLCSALAAPSVLRSQAARRPNILIAVSDDQSFAHAAGPGFDRVAQSGVRFTQAICASPGCAPSRAAILTGKYPWQLEEAGTHASLFPRKLAVYPELLENAGYAVGITGKGAGPCNFKDAGWPHNPAGATAPDFDSFLKSRAKGQPFCFWYGAKEPHRPYEPGAGVRAGKRLADIVVPPFLPDTDEVRSDLADYHAAIDSYHRQLSAILDTLERAGELENTLVVATSDNGMSFPGAKAQMREYGIHVPLAIQWPARVKGGRTCEELVSLADLAPTFLDAAGVAVPAGLPTKSLLPYLTTAKPLNRPYVLSGRERHSHARADLLGYPARAMRTRQYLYVRNFAPARWPAGDAPGYFDIDDGPSKAWMIAHRNDAAIQSLFDAAFGKHAAEELFDIQKDPGCLTNLNTSPLHRNLMREFRRTLDAQLRAQGDPRLGVNPGIWESYPRYSPTRPELGGFSTAGAYNPAYQKK
ncbi:MAG TPA: sulfatase [Paludibaculum sp.]|jgi:uncharacterized sulfatase